ncbi:hypothetical protein BJ508DRAFT_92612 [Ascobolus immersus RN42]|uniref:Uncharacterized protein n=1 Tax=Ascobolus immersus RN42 TaxID=1160509 RepID=A0A3N4I7X2_ASCIM|nr:hypothetical protein BJ508DRAFT_92612 [Ascobolus immersus RN42]
MSNDTLAGLLPALRTISHYSMAYPNHPEKVDTVHLGSMDIEKAVGIVAGMMNLFLSLSKSPFFQIVLKAFFAQAVSRAPVPFTSPEYRFSQFKMAAGKFGFYFEGIKSLHNFFVGWTREGLALQVRVQLLYSSKVAIKPHPFSGTAWFDVLRNSYKAQSEEGIDYEIDRHSFEVKLQGVNDDLTLNRFKAKLVNQDVPIHCELLLTDFLKRVKGVNGGTVGGSKDHCACCGTVLNRRNAAGDAWRTWMMHGKIYSCALPKDEDDSKAVDNLLDKCVWKILDNILKKSESPDCTFNNVSVCTEPEGAQEYLNAIYREKKIDWDNPR